MHPAAPTSSSSSSFKPCTRCMRHAPVSCAPPHHFSLLFSLFLHCERALARSHPLPPPPLCNSSPVYSARSAFPTSSRSLILFLLSPPPPPLALAKCMRARADDAHTCTRAYMHLLHRPQRERDVLLSSRGARARSGDYIACCCTAVDFLR